MCGTLTIEKINGRKEKKSKRIGGDKWGKNFYGIQPLTGMATSRPWRCVNTSISVNKTRMKMNILYMYMH